jgi:hypothetical protein
MPAASEGETIALAAPGLAQPDGTSGDLSARPRADYLITSRPNDSVLEILRARPLHEVGRFPLYGPFNLGRTRPTGLAYSPQRGLIAVATRTGSIHLVEIKERSDVPESRGSSVAHSGDSSVRR